MKKITIGAILLFSFVFTGLNVQAQLLKKLKDKVNQATDKVVGKKVDSTVNANTGGTMGEGGEGSTSSNGKPSNKGGAGLKNTPPPDVLQQIKDAEDAHNANNFSDARYSIQQALMGVEIQLAREILKSLPATINNLPKDTAQDKVMSTQWGWSNLSMQRVYTDGKDKQLTVTIGNNSFYAPYMNLYFNNTMVQADASQQNFKQVRVKGNKSIIQYENSKGYTLITPIGQASMIVWECINFADENEVMNAANSFDIDGIKKMLGEQ